MFIEQKISIIIPFFNSAQYLHRCLNSLINQNHKSIEILLIDDGSTDNSYAICKKYASLDKRIKIMRQNNKGQSSARNLGIKHSTGKFIFFLDSDDWIYQDALSSLMRAFEKSRAELVAGDFTKVKNGRVKEKSDISLPDSKLLDTKDLVEYTVSYLTKPNKYELFACSWGKLFQSSIIKKHKILFNIKLSTFEDVSFNYNYLKFCQHVYFFKKTIYDKTMPASYLSASKSIGENPKRLFGFHQALDKIAVYLNKKLDENIIKQKIGHAYVFLTIFQLVRICGQITTRNKNKIYRLIQEVVNAKNLRKNLQYYQPPKEYSKIIPFLLKLKFTWFIVKICRYKALKRYGYRTN